MNGNNLTAERLLAPFPEAWRDHRLSLVEWVETLLRPDTGGHLVHGGPGSGKTEVLEHVAQRINKDGRGVALGPFNLALYEYRADPDRIFADLTSRILDAVKAANTTNVTVNPLPTTAQEFPSQLLNHLGQLLQAMHHSGIRRAVLLLDDYDKLDRGVAVNLARYIRLLFDQHKNYFTFVLTAEQDLEELQTTESAYSPLRNVCEAHLLLDFTEEQMRRYADRLTRDWPQSLSDDDRKALWDYSGGYPALVNALLRKLKEQRVEGISTIEDAVNRCIRDYVHIEPLRTACHEIERWANVDAPTPNPARSLNDFVQRGTVPTSQSRTSRLLLAMGILGWKNEENPILTWRNQFIQEFFEGASGIGQRLLGSWISRPVSFRKGALSGQGQVQVSLFLDLGPLLAPAERRKFDKLRGTHKWRERVSKLKEKEVFNSGGSQFNLWQQQDELRNIGYDLNLFREQMLISAMPIYEAETRELRPEWGNFLGRFPELDATERENAEDMLKGAWRVWQRVRIQLTSDGAAHLILIRDLPDPLPLMQILDDLLGLERELAGSKNIALSVQWELALVVMNLFFEQIKADEAANSCLGLTWQGPEPPKKGRPLYPARDRYVIFRLAKLCNCRIPDGVRPQSERQLISIEDIDELRHISQSQMEDEHQDLYNYGKEIAGLLEGVMVQRESSNHDEQMNQDLFKIGQFPTLKLQEIQKVLDDDLSSWQNELFVASQDNAIIIHQALKKLPRSEKKEKEGTLDNGEADRYCAICKDWEENKIRYLYFPQRSVPYEDYWQCLVLGLQYIIEMRWTAQWVAQQSTENLASLAELMNKSVFLRGRKTIDLLRQNLALSTRMLAHLRDVSVPLFMAVADYATHKYEHAIRVSHLRLAIENAEKDIEALNNFLTQDRAERLNWGIAWVAIAGLLLTTIAIIVTFPSMWTDYFSFAEQLSGFNIDVSSLSNLVMAFLINSGTILVCGAFTAVIFLGLLGVYYVLSHFLSKR